MVKPGAAHAAHDCSALATYMLAQRGIATQEIWPGPNSQLQPNVFQLSATAQCATGESAIKLRLTVVAAGPAAAVGTLQR
jgi:hypothetical protein